jgi:hypothetical protein
MPFVGHGFEAGLQSMRGGESVWVLVDGAVNDQASMSPRMSETSNGTGVLGSARGTMIESFLHNETRDIGYVEGAGSSQGSRVAAGTEVQSVREMVPGCKWRGEAGVADGIWIAER